MAAIETRKDKSYLIKEFQALSTDEKPELQEINTGSQLLEVDTGSFFVWHIDGWVEL